MIDLQSTCNRFAVKAVPVADQRGHLPRNSSWLFGSQIQVFGESNRSATLIWMKQCMLGEYGRAAFDLSAALAHSGPVKLFLPWYPFRGTSIIESRGGADAPAILIQNTNRHGRVNILGEIHGS